MRVRKRLVQVRHADVEQLRDPIFVLRAWHLLAALDIVGDHWRRLTGRGRGQDDGSAELRGDPDRGRRIGKLVNLLAGDRRGGARRILRIRSARRLVGGDSRIRAGW